MTQETTGIEEVVKEAVKSVTRDDDGLLDIGKHDHEMLSDLIREALSSRDTYWKEQLQKARASLHTSLVAAVEGLPVYMHGTPKENGAIDKNQVLTIINSIFKE